MTSRVTVPLADGTTARLRLGVLDAAAERAFLAGQCLALAVAVAAETAWPLRVYQLVDHGEHVLHHAYAVTPSGALLDGAGLSTVETAAARARPPFAPPGIHASHVTASDACALLSRFPRLQPQDVETAAAFVPVILAAHGLGACLAGVADPHA